ncbi:MAG: DUF3108 domain-containing protein [Candidatus Omnitrophota bacterium]
MRKRRVFPVFLFLLFIVVIFAVKQINDNNPLVIIRHNGLGDKLSNDGNDLTFLVSYMGLIPAGEARLENRGEELYQGKQVYHLSAQAYLSGFYSKFFDLRAQIDSYLDKKGLYSLKFTQRLIVPNKPDDEKEVLYDQAQNFMELRGVKRKILPATQDPLSAIFYIRNQDLKIGKIFDININTNQKNYQFYAEVIARQEYTLASGKIGVWILKGSVHRRDKNIYHKTALKLWLLDNPSKIPVLVKAMTNGGQITSRLSATE